MSNIPTCAEMVHQIAAQAMMLHERLNANVDLPDGFSDSALIEARLEAWKRAVSEAGEQAELEAYWEWLGIDRARAERAVSPIELPSDVPLPAWAEVVAEALEITDFDELKAGLDESLPFAEVWLPFVAAVRQRLQTSPVYEKHLSDTARKDITSKLVRRVSLSAASTVYSEFDAYRTRRLGALAAFVKPGSTEIYRQFVNHLRSAQFMPLLGKYPMLARIIGNRSQLWGEMLMEFFQRFEADRAALVEHFAGGSDPGRITALNVGASDYHRGGRSTILISFESGLQLVYKPKPMGIEWEYNQFLAWMNRHHAPIDMKALTILDRGDYGWAEFASHQPMSDEAAARRYYRRIGALTCLLYVLLGTDCHRDNLIAHGEYPVAVDNETLFSHALFLTDNMGADARSRAYSMMHHSVLASLLLPQWTIAGVDPVAFDLSGVGSLDQQLLPATQTRWQHVNTDRVKPVQEQRKLESDANVPRIGDAIAYPEDYKEEIIAGFSATYRFFIEQRALFAGADSPLARFRGYPVRHVVRHSNAYSTLLNSAFHPARLKDGIDYSISFEMLARAYLGSMQDPTTKPILLAERDALMRGDLPLFSSYSDGTALLLDNGEAVAETYFQHASYDQMLIRIQSMDEHDLNWQCRFIDASIQSRVAVDDHQRAAANNNSILGMPADEPLSNAALRAEAAAIGQLLESEAIHGDDGSVTWVAASFHEPTRRHKLDPVNLSFYNGQAGIALFLAAAAGLNVWDGARNLCLAALQPIRQILRDSIMPSDIGGGFGLGAWIYLLTRAGRWLNTPELIDEARQAALRLSVEHLATDQNYDVLNGAAGTILSLLALYDVTDDADILARAVTCGKFLVNNRTPSSNGLRAWDTRADGTQWIGFSHGVAGIVYPLARLYSLTGEPEFSAAAEEAIDYENTRFDPEEGNWRRVFPQSLIEEEGDRLNWFWWSWCHGAPGIGLSRAASLCGLDTPQIHHDIDRSLTAIQYALSAKPTPNRFLCCGDMGRVECLFTMARVIGRGDLEMTARRYAAKIIHSTQPNGGYSSSDNTQTFPLHQPGLFTGISGMGYQMLRLLDPDRVPSALLWA